MWNAGWKQDVPIRFVCIWQVSDILFLGDVVYGPGKCPIAGLEGQTLHAGILGFIHPRTGEYMEFTAPLPEYFEKLLNTLPE